MSDRTKDNRARADAITTDDKLVSPPTVVVGHPHRHHMYETAQAYVECNALKAFVTERFLAESALTRLVRPALQLSPRLRKATSYSRASISSRVIVAAPKTLPRLAFRGLGAKVSSSSWTEAVVDAAQGADAVHLPCAGALDAFRALKGHGTRLILEQYVGDRRAGRKTLEREADTLGVVDRSYETAGYDWGRIERNEAEYELADIIVAGSQFVRDTLLDVGVSAEKIVVCQYGADITMFPYYERQRTAAAPLRVALVGTGAVRKGSLRLLRAVAQLSNVEVHLFGFHHDIPGGIDAWRNIATFHGSLPRADLARALRHCHVFAMPSVWEGSSLAVGEAMASGLPVIVTPNSGSPARDGLDGFVVPLGDETALCTALEAMRDEEQRRAMGRHARLTAEANTWSEYREALRRMLRARLG